MKNNLMVMGDSYSAHKDNVPEGSLPCYSADHENLIYRCNTEDMWWHKFCIASDLNPLLIAAASGSAISYTGWSGKSIEYSFIGRFEKYLSEGFFEKNKIDNLIIFGGTNDYWIRHDLGEIKHENITEADKENVLSAICYFFKLVKEALPKTKVIVLINDEIKNQISDTLYSEAKLNGFSPLYLKNIDKNDGHPTKKGMTQISEQVYKFFKEN